MKVVMLGDVSGKHGRNILEKFLAKNRTKYDLIIVNGENAAGGFGITAEIADNMFAWGVDAITSGNHIWDKKEIYPYLMKSDRLLRPANYPEGAPGVGHTTFKSKNGETVCVISLQGRIFMQSIDCPFATTKKIVDEAKKVTNKIFVDLHCETTSEKLAMGWYLDGQISMLVGTHTHVQTADEQIFPEGMGYITDLGMCGSHSGVLGVAKESILPRFLTMLPNKFELAEGNVRLCGVEATIDESGICTEINRINKSLLEVELS